MLSEPAQTAIVLVPGEEPIGSVMPRMSIDWAGAATNGLVEETPPRVVDAGLRLPTLFLHFLSDVYRLGDEEINVGLRAGNDNSEILLCVPWDVLVRQCGRFEILTPVATFLRRHGQAVCGPVQDRPGAFSPQRRLKTRIDPKKLRYELKTSRAKANVNLARAAYGIPASADTYMFAENHSSVLFASSEEKRSFAEGIDLLSEDGDEEASLVAWEVQAGGSRGPVESGHPFAQQTHKARPIPVRLTVLAAKSELHHCATTYS